MKELTHLYKVIKEELDFITKRSAKYINKKRSKGLDLKEGGIVYLLRKNIKIKRLSDKLDYTKLEPYKILKKLEPVNYEL